MILTTYRLGVVCCRVGKKPSLRGVHRNPIGVQLIVPTAAGLRAKRCKSCCRKAAPTVSNRRRRERKLELRNPQRAASIEHRSTRRADSLDDRPTGFGDTRLRVCHRELSQNCRGRSDFSASLFLPEVFFCKVVGSQIGVFNRASIYSISYSARI